MKDEIDFSEGKRGAAIPTAGKTRITIMLDDDVLTQFREKAQKAGTGYQTMINQTLREALAKEKLSSPESEEQTHQYFIKTLVANHLRNLNAFTAGVHKSYEARHQTLQVPLLIDTGVDISELRVPELGKVRVMWPLMCSAEQSDPTGDFEASVERIRRITEQLETLETRLAEVTVPFKKPHFKFERSK